jgi:hypothetical protein
VDAPASRDQLEAVVGSAGPHDDGNEDAALAHGRQDIRHVGGLAPVAHVDLAVVDLAEVDKVEFHGSHSL